MCVLIERSTDRASGQSVCGADRAVNLCVVLIERSICVWC